MDIKNLIDTAKVKSGLSFGEIANEMHIQQSRISEWKKGKYRPGPSEIIFLADKAGLPMLETLAEIEAQLAPNFARVWKNAVSAVRQNRG